MKNKTQRGAQAADIHRMYANVHKGKRLVEVSSYMSFKRDTKGLI